MSLRRSFDHCPNCGAPTPREYCDTCGQRNLDLHASLRALLGEALEELIGADSRVGRTLFALFFRPGLLSREYRLGKRALYTSPIKLYLAASALFFVLGAANPIVHVGSDRLTIGGHHDEDATTPALDKPAHLDDLRSILGRFGHVGRRAVAQVDRSFSPDPLVRADAKRAFEEGFVSGLPKAIFLLLPAFAVLLKLLFWRGRFLVDHAVFVLHLVAATLCLATAVSWLPDVWLVGGFALFTLYVVMALRTMYQQAWWKILPKALVFILVSLLLLVAAITLLAAVDFLTF